ncbi:MAG TPA: prolipoprotein diacylglyceryl transferase family protein [Candidatus Binatia bacterium]|nr:prolipoprotein diacylglyceryl transferase family protein [Candidatus Binatia bacterium]
MIPVLVQLGPIRLYSFGAMLALAFLAAGMVVENGLERRGLDRGHVTPIVLWAAIGGIAGSRVLALVNDWRDFVAAPLERLVTGAGFVWYGGLVGGFVAVSAYILLRGLPWLVVVDAIAPGLALGQAIGRIGCQLAGDGDWGAVSTAPWAMAYPRAIFGWDQAPGVLVHPAPVYESLLYSAIFLVLLRLSKQADRLAPGTVLFAYLIFSGIARFAIEFVRIEPRVWLGFTEAQWFGVATVAAGLVGLAWAGRRQRRLSAALGAVVLLASVVGAGCAGGKTAPDFVAQDLSGQAVRLSAFRGKVVFLNLWTTWCPPCRQEMPAMQQLAQKLAGDGFVMLAVSEDDEGAPVVKKFVDEMKLTFPVLVDSTGEVGRRFAITGYPETFIIDREGRQVARFIGPRDWRDPAIERDLKTLVDTGRWVRGPDGGGA